MEGTVTCYTYKYRLEVTGRLNNAVEDTTYVILSNIENITFEQAWKASDQVAQYRRLLRSRRSRVHQ